MVMKNLTKLLVMIWLLMIGINAGGALCSVCMAACISTGAGYVPCVIACCAATCFDNSTTIQTQKGEIPIS